MKNIWYNKSKTIMINLKTVESFVLSKKVYHTEIVNGGYGNKIIFKEHLNLNWGNIILWGDDAIEVWNLLK